MKRISCVLFFTIILLLAIRPIVLFRFSGADHEPYKDPFSFQIVRHTRHRPVQMVPAGRLIIAEESRQDLPAPLPLILKDSNNSLLPILLSAILSLTCFLGLHLFLFKLTTFRRLLATLSVWRI